MLGRLILPLMALAAIGMIALALVWPQGQARRAPAPFGRALAQGADERSVARPVTRPASPS